VAQALQHLWNVALDGTQAVLRDTLSQGEQTLAQQEQALQTRERELTERERSCAARVAALEESLALAREQWAAANGRANGLERSLQEREGECGRLRARIESLETNVSELRAKLDAASAAHHAERTQLQEQYTAAERRWLVEVDRARQHVKEATKEHEQQTRELRRRNEALASERDDLRHKLLEARADLKTAAAVREQLEERLRSTERAAPERASVAAATSKQARPSKPSRRSTNRRRPRPSE
jgi:chromosome segregation ATPase